MHRYSSKLGNKVKAGSTGGRPSDTFHLIVAERK